MHDKNDTVPTQHHAAAQLRTGQSARLQHEIGWLFDSTERTYLRHARSRRQYTQSSQDTYEVVARFVVIR
jgi:hypothetical protein